MLIYDVDAARAEMLGDLGTTCEIQRQVIPCIADEDPARRTLEAGGYEAEEEVTLLFWRSDLSVAGVVERLGMELKYRDAWWEVVRRETHANAPLVSLGLKRVVR